MDEMEQLKRTYWRTVSQTRKAGRISQSVIDKSEEKWKKFDPDIVMEALRIHVNHYKSYKENYTIGIMRNLQSQKADAKVKEKPKKGFNAYQSSRKYDWDDLESKLLKASMNRN